MQTRFLSRAIFILWAVVWLTAAPTVTHAQPDDWAAWLFDETDFRLTRINSAGYVDEVILPLAVDYDRLHSLDISPDGNRMAYVGENSATGTKQFLIYDHELRGVIGTYDLGDVLYVGAPKFSANGARVALGHALVPHGWEIVLIDLATLTITDALRNDDPAAASLPASATLAPYVQFYDGVQVAFALVLADAGGALTYDAFVWDTLGGSVEANQGYAQPYADRYPPTGEIIMTLLDDRLPASGVGFAPANTLQVYDPVSQTRYPFYHDAHASLGKPYFVNSGAYVLFAQYGADFSETWQVIDRVSGLIATYPPDFAPSSVIGTPNGFLYVQDRQVYAVDLAADSITTTLIYEFAADLPLSLVWLGSPDGVPLFGAGGYPAWARLLDADAALTPSDAEITSTDSANDSDDGTLRIGGTAIVNTTGGDSLNMRTAAGVSYQIRKKLSRGTEVTILDGPREANGYNWWLVRDASGLEGWVADFVGGTVTLLPRAYFGSDYAPNAEVAANPTMGSLLAVGDAAQVTLSNPRDALRMRNGAGLNFRVIALLPAGTRLQIVDGPRNADRLTWWQIRTPEGNVGWAAEIIGSERAITQTGSSPTPAAPDADASLIPPLLVAPLSGATVNGQPRTVNLRWSPVPNAQTYTLEIEACAGLTCLMLQTFDDLTETTSDLTVPAAGSYRWRVSAHLGEQRADSQWWYITFADE